MHHKIQKIIVNVENISNMRVILILNSKYNGIKNPSNHQTFIKFNKI